jgi:hypothetical protein
MGEDGFGVQAKSKEFTDVHGILSARKFELEVDQDFGGAMGTPRLMITC